MGFRLLGFRVVVSVPRVQHPYKDPERGPSLEAPNAQETSMAFCHSSCDECIVLLLLRPYLMISRGSVIVEYPCHAAFHRTFVNIFPFRIPFELLRSQAALGF